MNSSSPGHRRYEFLLPLSFNDGRPVPESLIAQTLIELETRFGAVTAESQRMQGRWRHQGDLYRDELVRVFIDVVDTQASRDFIAELQAVLKARFDQIDIWITSYQIDVL